MVCTTCRPALDASGGAEGCCGGELLFQALQDVLVRHPAEGALTLQPMSCLFACTSACTVYIRAPGKMGYLLGRFAPTGEDALALLDYAAAHLRSRDGTVSFADWPEGVKGHFIARLPPEDFVLAADPTPPLWRPITAW